MQEKRQIRKEDKRKAMVLGIVVLLAAAVVLFLISGWEERAFYRKRAEVSSAKDEAEGTIIYDDAEYVPKENVHAYLILGVDKRGEIDKESSDEKMNGNADTQMVLIVDDEAETWRILQLDRDTMVEMDLLDYNGRATATVYQQLALAFNYGGSMTAGARNAVRTVENLLWGEQMDGYYAMNLDAIAVLTDLVGGVPVKVTTDFTEVDESLVLGETVTLTGENAEHFVRTRRTVDDGTNIARMARQREYMSGLIKQASSMSEQKVLELYDALMTYSVTNLGSGNFVDIAEKTKKYTQLDLVQIGGNSARVGDYMEFTVDQDSLADVILELFYEKK